MRPGPTIVWYRHDLRTADQPALHWALERTGPVIPVFIHAPEEEGDWPPGGASKWWLHRSLAALDKRLRQLKSRLILCEGPTLKALRHLVKQTEATAVCWCRRYEPAITARDETIK